MDAYIFFFFFLITISPFVVEATLIKRQIKISSSPRTVPTQLQNYLPANEFLRAQIFKTNAEYFHLFVIVFMQAFVISLEMCLGLVPCFWQIAEDLVVEHDNKIKHSIPQCLIFIVIIFNYEYLKYMLCEIFRDLIVTQRRQERRTLKLCLAWKLIFQYMIGLLVVAIVGFAIVLAVVFAGEFYYVWFWLYYCLCQWAYALFVWPYCVLPLTYSLKCLPNCVLRDRIVTHVLKFKFPHYEILLAKRRPWVDFEHVIYFANACCRKRIIIEKLCLSPTYSVSDMTNKGDTDEIIPDRSRDSSDLGETQYLRGTIIAVKSKTSLRQEGVISSSSLRPQALSSSDSSTHENIHSTTKLELQEVVSKSSLQRGATQRDMVAQSDSDTGGSPMAQQFDIVELKYTPELGQDPARTLSMENILAVLLQGFASWKLNHWILRILAMNCVIVFWFPILAFIANLDSLYSCFGFTNGATPTFAGIFIVLMYLFRPVYMLNRFISNLLSRHQVFEADRYVMKLDNTTPLAEALIKIYINRVRFPLYDRWYARYYLSAPTLLERLDYLATMHSTISSDALGTGNVGFVNTVVHI